MSSEQNNMVLRWSDVVSLTGSWDWSNRKKFSDGWQQNPVMYLGLDYHIIVYHSWWLSCPFKAYKLSNWRFTFSRIGRKIIKSYNTTNGTVVLEFSMFPGDTCSLHLSTHHVLKGMISTWKRAGPKNSRVDLWEIHTSGVYYYGCVSVCYITIYLIYLCISLRNTKNVN